jgi:hypothetical protein
MDGHRALGWRIRIITVKNNIRQVISDDFSAGSEYYIMGLIDVDSHLIGFKPDS